MQVAKWGNSLAVRIPAKMVKELGLKEGDSVELALTAVQSDEELTRAEKRANAIEQLKNLRGSLTSEDLNYRREDLYRY